MRFSSASAASVVHSNLSYHLRSLKKGKPRSPSLDKNRFKAAMQPVSFWMSLMVAGASMAMMALIFSGLASIPWLLMINPSSFPESTPKTHLVGLSFQAELPEAVEGLFQVSNKLILGLGFDNDIINIGFNIAM